MNTTAGLTLHLKSQKKCPVHRVHLKTNDDSSIQKIKPYTRQQLDSFEEYFTRFNILKFKKAIELALHK